MRWTLIISDEAQLGIDRISDQASVVTLPSTFDPNLLSPDFVASGLRFDAVIFSVPAPELTEAQLDAIDSVLKGAARA